MDANHGESDLVALVLKLICKGLLTSGTYTLYHSSRYAKNIKPLNLGRS